MPSHHEADPNLWVINFFEKRGVTAFVMEHSGLNDDSFPDLIEPVVIDLDPRIPTLAPPDTEVVLTYVVESQVGRICMGKRVNSSPSWFVVAPDVPADVAHAVNSAASALELQAK